jgi:hypothetical protein
MRSCRFLFFAVLFLLAVAPAQADEILAGTYFNAPYGGGRGLYPGNFLAQSFSLPSAANITSIVMSLNGRYPYGPGQFVLQLTNAIGPNTTSSNVFASVTGTYSDQSLMVTVPLPITLAGGTYYIVLSTSTPPPTQAFWPMYGSSLPGTFGSIGGGFETTVANFAFPPASDWHTMTTPFEFQVNGSPVPEPATLLLVASGLTGIWLRRRR